MPNAEIVSIGSELLLGQPVDTNSAWMAQRLTSLGIDLFHTSVIGDNRGRMAEVIGRARDRADVVICGGGLGPTQDDLTLEVIAEVTGRPLVRDQGLVADIERMFASRGLRMTANNERQAMIPESATVLDNPNGTAPAFAVEDDRGVLCALPGVPLELKWLFDHALVPVLGERYQLAHTISYRVLKVVGMGESAIDDQIGDLIASSSNPTVGVLAHPGQVDVRIAAKAAAALIEPVELAVRRLLGEHVFGTDDESLEGVVSALLRQRALTVASHEDVTRGMLAEMLLAAAGSAYLEGVVSAVGDDASDASEADDAVAARRVAALRERYGAQVAVAIHGVPARDAALGVAEAGVNLRPGRTSVAVAVGERVLERPFRWAGTGSADRTRTTRYALALLREALRQ